MRLNEKQKTAYHEAGHCFRAWEHRLLGVLDTCVIEGPPGEWRGSTQIRRKAFTSGQRTEIALAGLLVEAKAIATDVDPVQEVLTSAVVAASIRQLYVAQDIPVAGPGVVLPPDDAWPIEIPIVGQDPVFAFVTLSDLAEIPLDHRDVKQIGDALNALANFLNEDITWDAIQAIARELANSASGCLNHFLIYEIIRTATDPHFANET